MIDLPNTDIDDDIPDEREFGAPQRQKRSDAAAVIARLSLGIALDRKSRAVFKRHPSLSVIGVPNESWIDLVEAEIARMDRAPIVKCVTEKRKSGGVFQRVGADDLKWLHSGRSMLYISQDPEGLIDEAVLAGADAVITVQRMTPVLLRQSFARSPVVWRAGLRKR